MFGGRRSNGGGTLYHTNEPFEPAPGIGKTAKIDIVSTTKEKLTIKDKQYDCTKIVRKIDQPLDEKSIISSWNGTSTLWICNELPLGLAKTENAYENVKKGQRAKTRGDLGHRRVRIQELEIVPHAPLLSGVYPRAMGSFGIS
jgi:hypothetical protein